MSIVSGSIFVVEKMKVIAILINFNCQLFFNILFSFEGQK